MRFLSNLVVMALSLSGCAAIFPARDAPPRFSAEACTIQGGYAFAAAGGLYRGGCAEASEPAFLTGYVLGRKIYAERDARRIALANYDAALAATESYGRARHYEAQYKVPPNRPVRPKADDDLVLAGRRLDQARAKLAGAEDAAAALLAEQSGPALTAETAADRDVLLSAHAFARENEAIDHCTDNRPYGAPRCVLHSGARLVDARSGEICAEGAGELRFEGSEPRKIGNLDGRADIYSFHGRPRAGGRGGGVALISADGRDPQAACVPVRLDP